jgi:U6 snRNA-associated Sm-like protein LSm4
MVETKNGETYDGVLAGCDNFMNMKFNKVIITSKDGVFSKCDEVFIRGNNIKSIRIEDTIIDKHQQELKR